MIARSETLDRFHIRQLGRELAAIGLVESRTDYVKRWLGGDEGHSIDSVPLTDRLFLSLHFGLMLAKLELDDDLHIERDPDINWMLRAKRMALGRIEKLYGQWLGNNAVFRPDIEL